MLWKKVFLILILVAVGVVVVLILILLWRIPADAQEKSIPDLLIATATENMQSYGFRLKAEYIGNVENVDETLKELLNPNQSFFFVQGQKGIVRTLRFLLDTKRGDELRSELRRVMSKQLSAGDFIYSVAFGGAESQLTVSPDGRSYSGAFALFSRLPVAAYYPKQPRRTEDETCALKVITRNIFGQEAERIRACIRVYCTRSNVDNCELLSIESKSGFFGNVVSDPQFAPAQGTVYRSYCRGPVRYKWGVGLGAIRTSKFGEFELENFRMSGQGTIMPELSCR